MLNVFADCANIPKGTSFQPVGQNTAGPYVLAIQFAMEFGIHEGACN
jgi:hypothetical protein